MERSPLARDATTFGHPRGLIVLAGTELWDRISFSGMQAILVLYMVERLFIPGHPEHILGFPRFREAIETIVGHLTGQGLATQIFGLYVGITYLTPLFGGMIGDRWIGRRRAVLLGALLMTAGHFCMAFEVSFLPALGLISLGAGFLRGNLTPQVAELYSPGDERRAVAFQIYACMVAIGAFLSPLVTGWLSQAFDWHVAFTFAGVGMLAGLIWYWLGQGFLPAEPRSRKRMATEPLSDGGRRIVRALLAIIPFCALFWVAQAQVWNTYNLWVRDHVDLQVGRWTIPVPWLQALDGLCPLLAMPLLLTWWRRRADVGIRSDELSRMATGCAIFAFAVLLLAAGKWTPASNGKVLIVTPIAFHLLSNIGWLYFQPSANSLFSGAAPPGFRGTMVGAYTVSMFAGSIISGRLGALYEFWPPVDFWLLHAAIVGAAAIALFTIAPRLRRAIGSDRLDAAPNPAEKRHPERTI